MAKKVTNVRRHSTDHKARTDREEGEFLRYMKNTEKEEEMPEWVLTDPGQTGLRSLHGMDFNFEVACKILMRRLKEHMPTNMTIAPKLDHNRVKTRPNLVQDRAKSNIYKAIGSPGHVTRLLRPRFHLLHRPP